MGVAHVLHGASRGSVVEVASVVAMWFAMMSVMMAPAVWPWVVAFRRFNVDESTSSRMVSTAAFVGGYGLAWLLYSVLAALIQVTLTTQSAVDASARMGSAAASLLLVAAGLVQFSSFKRACLTHCRNPFSYLLARWRQGPMPAWRIGFAHGSFCVGCCWALMGTMLAVGVMNLWWMAALTVATFLEQFTRRGELVRRAIGLGLIAAGCVHVFVPLA